MKRSKPHRRGKRVSERGLDDLVRRPVKQMPCGSTSCADVYFEWNKASLQIFEQGITPRPTADERDLIGIAILNPQLTINPQPLPFPDKVNIIPCIGACECRTAAPMPFPPAFPIGGIHRVTIPTPNGNRTFFVPYTILVSISLQVGRCER